MTDGASGPVISSTDVRNDIAAEGRAACPDQSALSWTSATVSIAEGLAFQVRNINFPKQQAA